MIGEMLGDPEVIKKLGGGGVDVVCKSATRTGAGTTLGAVAHMIPERAVRKHINTCSDIFSFGPMLGEVLIR